jgi:phosphopantetheinyl transferase (holo-ACP synthase)
MIGNDVVDLSHPAVQPGARHVRFDARVFARREREALAASGAPDRLRWMLWAAKEAAYKVAKKLEASTVWSPRRFLVELDANLLGQVVHENRKLPVLVEEDGAHIHAIVSDSEPTPEAQRWRVGHLAVGEEESLAARALAIADLAPELGLAPEAMSFERRGRIPILCVDERPIDVDLSLSHHGAFVAWAADLRGAEGGAR